MNNASGRFPLALLSHLPDNPSAKAIQQSRKSQYQKYSWDVPGGPEVKTPHFYCKGHGFHSGQELRSGKSHGGQRKEYTLIPLTPFILPQMFAVSSVQLSFLFASSTSTPFPFTHQNHTLYLEPEAHLFTRAWSIKKAGWLSHLKNTAKAGTLGKKINRRPQLPGFSVACEPKLFWILFQFSSVQSLSCA